MPTFCSYFDSSRCRSCDWIEQDYEAQLARKEQALREALQAVTGLSGAWALEPSARSAPQGFRNRAKMSVTGSLEAPIIGLVGGSDLDEGRELLSCPIHHPRLNELFEAMPAWIRKYRLTPYRIRERRGELKGLIAFHSPLSEQTYVRFVLRSRECLARLRELLPELQTRFPSVVCASANLQPIPHALLEGPEEILLTQRASIEHRMGAVTLRLAPQAFVQTNAQVATALYETAARWIKEARPERMLELFCGQGAFSFFAAQSARELKGIEINADAVAAATESAREQGLSHLSFEAADAAHVDAEIARFCPELILVNPPRRGLGAGVALIERHEPRDFLYSSCSVETLSRDLAKLSSRYVLRRAQLFDMFPHTAHFEALVWLSRREPC